MRQTQGKHSPGAQSFPVLDQRQGSLVKVQVSSHPLLLCQRHSILALDFLFPVTHLSMVMLAPNTSPASHSLAFLSQAHNLWGLTATP